MTFTPIAKHFMLYCRLIYMLSMLYVRLTIKVKVGIPESFKVVITGSSHLKDENCLSGNTKSVSNSSCQRKQTGSYAHPRANISALVYTLHNLHRTSDIEI